MGNNAFGKILTLSTFGESHGAAMGGILDGMPAGLAIDPEQIQRDLDRRRPGQSDLTTPRNEEDRIQILSGIYEGKTLGTPIGFLIKNKDQHSDDYGQFKDQFRFGHADKTYEDKFGHRDHRGGGRSSARETANWVAGGAFARQLLAAQNIRVSAYVSQVKDVHLPLPYSALDLSKTFDNNVRCPHSDTAAKMEALIRATKEAGNSVGGMITGVIQGVPAGLGEPVFYKMHSALGAAMLGINAAKSFELGNGREATLMYGSEYNPQGALHGGVSGGISNGDDIWFQVGFKAVATLMKGQRGSNRAGEEIEIVGKGRHDPCVLPRAVPIVEALAALVTADLVLLARSARI